MGERRTKWLCVEFAFVSHLASVRTSSLVLSEQSKGGAFGAQSAWVILTDPSSGEAGRPDEACSAHAASASASVKAAAAIPPPNGPVDVPHASAQEAALPGQAPSSHRCCSVPATSHSSVTPMTPSRWTSLQLDGQRALSAETGPQGLVSVDPPGCGCTGPFLDGGHTGWICSFVHHTELSPRHSVSL